MKLLLAIILLTPLVPASVGSDNPCNGPQPALGIIQITGGSWDTTVYIDDRNYLNGNGLWTYAETNGHWSGHLPGVYVGDPDHVDLQRGNLRILGGSTPDDVELCVDDPHIVPDAVIG